MVLHGTLGTWVEAVHCTCCLTRPGGFVVNYSVQKAVNAQIGGYFE